MIGGHTYRRIFEIFLSVLGIIAIALVLNERLTWLFSKDFPNATDSFYYLQELKHRLSTGEGYYIQHSFFFSFWTAVGKIFSVSEFFLHDAIFLSSILLFTISVYLFLKDSSPLWIILAMIAIYLSSDIVFYRTYGFMKQGFAVGLFSLGLSLISLKNAKEKFLLKGAGFLLILAGSLTHIFVAAVALAFLPALFEKNKKNAAVLAVLGLFIAVFLAANLLNYPKLTFGLNSIAESGWVGACEKLRCPAYEYLEFYVYSFLVLFMCPLVFYRSRSIERNILLTALIICVFLNLPIWVAQGDMRERLAYSSVWIFFIASFNAIRLNTKLIEVLCYLAFIVITCCLNLLHRRSYDQAIFPVQTLKNSSTKLMDWISKDSFILANHGHEFIITYFLDTRSADKLPKKEQAASYYQMKSHIKGLSENSNCISVTREISPETSCVLIDENWLIRKIS